MILNPIEYPKLNKFEIKVTEIVNDKLFFDILEPISFRYYIGQKIVFDFDGTIYQGIYGYLIDDTTNGLKKHYLSNDTNGFLWEFDIDQILDIYDTFHVSEDNQAITFQDFASFFVSSAENFKLGFNSIYEYYNKNSKPGLMSPFDKSKLDNINFLIKSKHILELDIVGENNENIWTTITVFKTDLSQNESDGKSNNFKLVLKNTITNDILSSNINVINDINNSVIIFFSVEHCSIDYNNQIELRFSNMIFDDGFKRIKIEARINRKISIAQTHEIYLGINRFDSLNNSMIGFISETVVLFNNSQTEVVPINKDLLEINNKTIRTLSQQASGTALILPIAPIVYNPVTGELGIDVKAFAPFGTVSFPGFGIDHSKAAYGDHTHNDYKSIYDINLPSATSVANRCSGAIAGVDYPVGWTVMAYNGNQNDLLIIHNLNRKIAQVTIFTMTSFGERLLYGNASHSGVIAQNSNTLRIEGLATVQQQLFIHLFFS